MDDNEREQLRRELLALAGYTVRVRFGMWELVSPFGASATDNAYDEQDEAWNDEDAPALTVDWLLSLLPDELNVNFGYLRYTGEYTVEIDCGAISCAATRLDALALAVRAYLNARADNGAQ